MSIIAPYLRMFDYILVTVKVNFRLAAPHAAEDIPIGASVIVYPYYRITDITLQQ